MNARSLDAGDPNQIKELMKGHDVAVNGLPKQFALDVLGANRMLSENEIVFSKSRKAKIITTGIH